eukprot:CAMPEP_0170615266 /NCGR_PEP_ID=MMETSP0224-20130122/25244_1 /TAXON_ID=285029 /ORGANISM="Togula jolla, Strain CCCM 725" /LENGTH=69 /DNA_ID=CAMNT_0010940983 /DNA_START=371 /DNA_END=576 /DNA_ORIENTATION=-
MAKLKLSPPAAPKPVQRKLPKQWAMSIINGPVLLLCNDTTCILQIERGRSSPWGRGGVLVDRSATRYKT